MIIEESLEVGDLYLISLVEVHELEESVEFDLLDFFFLNSEDALEAPLEIILQYESIEVSIKALECLFNSDILLDDPLLDLLYDGVFPIKTISESISSNSLC